MAKLLSFLVESVDQISTKPIAFQQNMPRKLPWNQPFCTDHFQRNLPWEFLWISCEISYFSVNLTLKLPRNLTFFHHVSEALSRVCHHQHLLRECEASLLCRHERSCCLIDKVYCKECFDFEGSTTMKTVTVVILESRPFRSGLVLFPFAFLHPSCGAALSIRFEV